MARGRVREHRDRGQFPRSGAPTVVTEIFDCSRVPEDQREDIDNGNIWVEDMRRTLERLDRLCTS